MSARFANERTAEWIFPVFGRNILVSKFLCALKTFAPSMLRLILDIDQ